ncbi:MAG: molecular chaperone Hsp33 [Gammaproteobacteria bacterium]|jgi:molecular chaperone Hsp33
MSDILNKFLFDDFAVRGSMIQLDDVWQRALEHNEYDSSLESMVGQLMAATGLLSASIKFRGQITFQIQSQAKANAPLRVIVAQGTNQMALRGVARPNDEYTGLTPESQNIKDWVGNGQAVITIRNQEQAKPYQGVVPLEGDSLATVLEGYFERSEQLPTRLWLVADGKRAAGFMLQRMPGQADNDSDGWNRVVKLAETIKDEELLSLSAPDLLHRLYHEEDVRLFDPRSVSFNCNGCEQRFVEALTNMGKDELNSVVAEMGSVDVTCDFCSKVFSYDAVDVEQMFAEAVPVSAGDTQH